VIAEKFEVFCLKALLLSLPLLIGCASQAPSPENADALPTTFPYETFLEMTNSTCLARAEATVRVAGAVCGEMSSLTDTGPAATADEALKNAATQLDADLFRMGANAYAIEAYQWPAAFPACLNGAPLLLPGPNAAVRGEIDRWLGEARLYPRIVGEFDDSALMKVFAQAGEGYFPAPAIISDEICARYGVSEVGRVDEVREAFWLISTERRIQHPEVRAVLEEARRAVFVPHGGGETASERLES
jgi:LysR substrate binding domain